MNSALAPETYATIAAALAGAVVITKKLISRWQKSKPDLVTRPEFQAGMEAMRNRIGAGYLALSEKIDSLHSALAADINSVRKDLSAQISEQSATFERRLDSLDSAVARLDERTKAL